MPDLKANPDYVNLMRMFHKYFEGNVKIVEREFLEQDTALKNKP